MLRRYQRFYISPPFLVTVRQDSYNLAYFICINAHTDKPNLRTFLNQAVRFVYVARTMRNVRHYLLSSPPPFSIPLFLSLVAECVARGKCIKGFD